MIFQEFKWFYQWNISSRLNGFFYGYSMGIHQSIAQVFENNIGNRITRELASGMIRSLVEVLAASIQQQADDTNLAEMVQPAPAEVLEQQKEGTNGLV